MTDERLDELIDRHLNGSIDERELAELEERLLHSAADRERFWKLAEVHSFLHEHLQGGVESASPMVAVRSAKERLQTPSGLSNSFAEGGGPRRSFAERTATMGITAALAAGILIGLFGASVVWAMVGGRTPGTKLTPLPLMDGGFESSQSLRDEGVPVTPRVWSGDFAAVVASEGGITPIEGRRMLQFRRGDNRLTPPDVKSSVAEMWQVVDLGTQQVGMAQRPVVVDVSARFNATAEAATERVAFGLSVLAFAGDVAEMPDLWRGRRELALAAADKEELADASPGSWQKLTAQITVPLEANLLLVQLRATRKGAGPRGEEFGQTFADDVVLGVRSEK